MEKKEWKDMTQEEASEDFASSNLDEQVSIAHAIADITNHYFEDNGPHVNVARAAAKMLEVSARVCAVGLNKKAVMNHEQAMVVISSMSIVMLAQQDILCNIAHEKVGCGVEEILTAIARSRAVGGAGN